MLSAQHTMHAYILYMYIYTTRDTFMYTYFDMLKHSIYSTFNYTTNIIPVCTFPSALPYDHNQTLSQTKIQLRANALNNGRKSFNSYMYYNKQYNINLSNDRSLCFIRPTHRHD